MERGSGRKGKKESAYECILYLYLTGERIEEEYLHAQSCCQCQGKRSMTRGRVKGCASASSAVGVCLDSAPTLAWKVQFCAVSTTGNSNDNNNDRRESVGSCRYLLPASIITWKRNGSAKRMFWSAKKYIALPRPLPLPLPDMIASIVATPLPLLFAISRMASSSASKALIRLVRHPKGRRAGTRFTRQSGSQRKLEGRRKNHISAANWIYRHVRDTCGGR